MKDSALTTARLPGSPNFSETRMLGLGPVAAAATTATEERSVRCNPLTHLNHSWDSCSVAQDYSTLYRPC